MRKIIVINLCKGSDFLSDRRMILVDIARKDIINSKSIETIELNKIFRQAAQSKIITNAHLVNQGESFINTEDEDKDKKQDFFYINESDKKRKENTEDIFDEFGEWLTKVANSNAILKKN